VEEGDKQGDGAPLDRYQVSVSPHGFRSRKICFTGYRFRPASAVHKTIFLTLNLLQRVLPGPLNASDKAVLPLAPQRHLNRLVMSRKNRWLGQYRAL
jgi:hypothetical protein